MPTKPFQAPHANCQDSPGQVAGTAPAVVLLMEGLEGQAVISERKGEAVSHF